MLDFARGSVKYSLFSFFCGGVSEDDEVGK